MASIFLAGSNVCAEAIVIASRDQKAAKALIENWDIPGAEVRSRFIFVEKDGARIAIEKILVVGDRLGWYTLALKVATENVGKSGVRYGDINPAEQAAMKKLIRGSPLAPHFAVPALKNPDLKHGFSFALKSRFETNGKVIEDQFKLVTPEMTRDLATPNLKALSGVEAEQARKAAWRARREQAAKQPVHVFVSTEIENAIVKTKLNGLALDTLLDQQMEESEKIEKIRKEVTDKAVKDGQSGSEKWDGKSEIEESDLPPEICNAIELHLLTYVDTFGFRSKEACRAFLNSSMPRGSRFELMISISGQNAKGLPMSSWGIGGIDP
ncbi:MAG: hypothetical protein IT203_05530 [Fimbriimonadaceae bacterium]|nr:hypothetical protein [Fimbriimonadaceae bacterium]